MVNDWYTDYIFWEFFSLFSQVYTYLHREVEPENAILAVHISMYQGVSPAPTVQVSPPGFLLTLTTCLSLGLQSLNHPPPGNDDAFGNCGKSTVISLFSYPSLAASTSTCKMRWEAISLGNPTLGGWDAPPGPAVLPGGKTTGGKGPQTSTTDPTAGSSDGTGRSNARHAAHASGSGVRRHSLQTKNEIHAWRMRLGQGLPNYLRPGAVTPGKRTAAASQLESLPPGKGHRVAPCRQG